MLTREIQLITGIFLGCIKLLYEGLLARAEVCIKICYLFKEAIALSENTSDKACDREVSCLCGSFSNVSFTNVSNM